jgi:signal peptidase I
MNVRKTSATGIQRLGLGRVKTETRKGYFLLCMALWSIVSFLFIQHFMVTTVVVQGKSMMPTLHPGDCCFVNCLLPRLRDYKRGDIVVIRDSSRHELIVKRIVGLPQDHVQLRDGRVYVNGLLLPEHYLDSRTRTYSRQLRDRVITIGKDSYFVMGDNRLESDDSRYFGDIDRHDLIGLISR